MPQLTRELIIKQRKANGLPYPTPPSSIRSASPYRSPSPRPSRVAEWSSPGASSSTQPHTLRRTTQRTNPKASNRCWIPSLDEVSRADPVQCMLLFQRLADEAHRDEQRGPQSRNVKSQPRKSEHRITSRRAWPTPKRRVSVSVPVTKPDVPSVGIGALALQLVRPCASHLVQHPTISSFQWHIPVPETTRAGFVDSSEPEEKNQGVDWCLNIPESPRLEVWAAGGFGPSEEVISQWVKEDVESERRLQEERDWKFWFVV